jgi:large subunit ribosomal protein L10
MPTLKKEQIVEELASKLSASSITIGTSFGSIPVNETTKLRKELRARGVEYRVIKNTLAKLAAEKASRPDLVKIIEGPTALAFGKGDPTEAAKAVVDYLKANRLNLTLLGAFLDGRVLSAEEVQSLASLPPKPVLIAQLQGRLQSPLYGLAWALGASLAGLARVLQERVRQLEARGA